MTLENKFQNLVAIDLHDVAQGLHFNNKSEWRFGLFETYYFFSYIGISWLGYHISNDD